MKTEQKYMRAGALSKHLGIGKSTLYLYITQNKIPQGKKISEKVVLFNVAEVEKALGLTDVDGGLV